MSKFLGIALNLGILSSHFIYKMEDLEEFSQASF